MKKRQPIGNAILMITQLGISMIVPIFVGAYIGYWLDHWLDTGFLFFVFLVMGMLAAFRNVHRLLKPFYASSLEREKKEQAYWASLKADASKKQEPEEQAAEENMAVPDGVKTAEPEFRTMREEKKTRRQEAEEEFDAWRRKNTRQ